SRAHSPAIANQYPFAGSPDPPTPFQSRLIGHRIEWWRLCRQLFPPHPRTPWRRLDAVSETFPSHDAIDSSQRFDTAKGPKGYPTTPSCGRSYLDSFPRQRRHKPITVLRNYSAFLPRYTPSVPYLCPTRLHQC